VRQSKRCVIYGACAATIMLAGCSGGGGIASPAIGSAVQLAGAGVIREPVRGFVNSAALARQATTIAVADAKNNVVNIYDPAGNALAQLTGFAGPAGLASDIKGDLYVADLENQRVKIYAAGFQTPPTILASQAIFRQASIVLVTGRS
jgi:hypothetical protein